MRTRVLLILRAFKTPCKQAGCCHNHSFTRTYDHSRMLSDCETNVPMHTRRQRRACSMSMRPEGSKPSYAIGLGDLVEQISELFQLYVITPDATCKLQPLIKGQPGAREDCQHRCEVVRTSTRYLQLHKLYDIEDIGRTVCELLPVVSAFLFVSLVLKTSLLLHPGLHRRDYERRLPLYVQMQVSSIKS